MKKQIFVFGSNREGRHGKGAALEARTRFGAVHGQAEGLQGNSYAIITKELRRNHQPVTLNEIKQGIIKLTAFAAIHPEMQFNVTPIGCGLAGWKPKDIAPLFGDKILDNIILPNCFKAPY